MKKIFFMAAMAALSSLCMTSCNNDDDMGSTSAPCNSKGTPIKFNVTLDDFSSRAATTKTAWQTNDAVGITAYLGNTSAAGVYTNSQVNTKVTFDGNLWNPARNISLYQAPAYISAYSPYNAEISDPTDISVTNAVDWLYAPLSTAKAITAGTPKVTIKMNHAFAIVKYTLVNDGYTGPGKLTKAEIKSNGYGTAASLNSTTGKLNNITGLDVATVAEYASGKFVANSGDKQSDMFMVVPVVGNEEQITFTLTVDGQKYVSTMKIALNQGMIYEFPLKITDTGIDFNGGGEGGEGGDGDGNGTVIIMPWTTENVNSSNLNAAN